jgi:hypothetical protein
MPDNSMVERFNRRLGEHLDRMPQNRTAHHRRFLDHAERDAYLLTFVANYNCTRLRCLGYQAPAELLAKLTGHYTCAGVNSSSRSSRRPATALGSSGSPRSAKRRAAERAWSTVLALMTAGWSARRAVARMWASWGPSSAAPDPSVGGRPRRQQPAAAIAADHLEILAGKPAADRVTATALPFGGALAVRLADVDDLLLAVAAPAEGDQDRPADRAVGL